ncbi:alpha/beta hydrolase [Mangrovibacter phragmitis]|uniref:Alpha/beta hydrolase n=1 Tax=Mangrovibacter phragmitis TaxID=1691903 RepID=A0A1B7L8R0_9ENTR|nr:alpha/beta hydrolase [Mangrovibacter phragmitis]
MFKNKTVATLMFTALLGASNLSGAEMVKNIVLVHGAFTDGSSWSEVTERLQQKGFHVTSVQNPLTSLADDVTATERVLARQHGDVLLVGHSWAGAVVTQAGNASRVRGIVYLSALVPDSGESVSGLLTRLGAPMGGMEADKNGLIWLDNPADFRRVMAGDVPEEKVKLLTASHQPISASAFDGLVSHAAWKEKPTWYLMTKDDRALPYPVQQKIVKMTGSVTEQISSSHMSMISHPAEVATFIERAARSFK